MQTNTEIICIIYKDTLIIETKQKLCINFSCLQIQHEKQRNKMIIKKHF